MNSSTYILTLFVLVVTTFGFLTEAWSASTNPFISSSHSTSDNKSKISTPEQLGKKTKTEFIQALLNQMTLEEKIGQLNQYAGHMDQTGDKISDQYISDIAKGKVGSILNVYSPEVTLKLQKMAIEQSRMKIPLLIAYDVIHGHRTIFPIPLGESSSWDLSLMEQTARVAAKEAAADGIHWTFSPMVDVTRDPRWGRVSEGAGEDPWLGSKVAIAKVKGYQGDNLKNPDSVLACVKHFALYGAPIGGRDYSAVDMSQRAMFETYFPPYQAAINAGAATVMSSFNDVNGIPATANRWLQTKILREDWGFKGFLVTDYWAIPELVKHGTARNTEHAALLAKKAGIDMDMQGSAFNDHLYHLVKNNLITEGQIEESARRVLSAKYDLGLFDDPYRKVSDERANKIHMSKDHLALARKIGRESVVLLKNNKGTLPLKPGSKLAVIGPLADNKRDLIGNWSAAGDWKKAVSVLEGLNAKTKMQFQINYEKGANLIDDPVLLKRLNSHRASIETDPRSPSEMISAAVKLAESSDIILAVVGESQAMTGEAASVSDIGIPSNQVALLKALKQTKKPIVLVLMNGRPLTLKWENDNMDALLETWFLGSQAGNSIADVLVGDYNPSGKLTMSFPQNIGQIPIFYSHKNTGRPALNGDNWYTSRYLDVSNQALYPFGFGLSYSEFEYGKPTLKDTKPLTTGQKLRVSTTITNKSSIMGTEIAQLYINRPVELITHPVKELKSFKKIDLKPGETKIVEFEISYDDLYYYDENLNLVTSSGSFTIMIGSSSEKVQSVQAQVSENKEANSNLRGPSSVSADPKLVVVSRFFTQPYKYGNYQSGQTHEFQTIGLLETSLNEKTLTQATISINTDKKSQKIEGYGAALTEAAVVNILKLQPNLQAKILKDLFSKEFGAGLNLIRIPMGSSDLADGSRGEYTYDDTPENRADFDMNYFSMKRDEKTLQLVQRILAINPEVHIMINPWTAPPWMKSNQSFYQGHMQFKYYLALANYFIRTIQEYHKYGIEVHYVGIQNEPGISIDYPSMLMSADNQSAFIQILGERIKKENFVAKIIANDDNYNSVYRVKGLLDDPNTAKHIGAVGFHCWSNDPYKAKLVSAIIPTFETECGGNINSGNYGFDFYWWLNNRVIDGANNGLAAVITWNMVADEKAGPYGAGPRGCKTCRGLITVKPTMTRPDDEPYELIINSEMRAITQASKFIQRGAYKVESHLNESSELTQSAFLNPDGSIVIIIGNNTHNHQNISIIVDGKKHIVERLTAGDTVSLRINQTSNLVPR